MNRPPPDVKSVFGRAAEISSPNDRAAFLKEACTGFPDVRAEVQGLLDALGQAGSFMRAPAAPVSETGDYEPPVTEAAGATVGPYKLLQQIGEGGMGVVFMAEQEHPIRRRVALKIIKPGMDSRQVIARFEAERQALALMDHQNIARVLDAGTTEHGSPYFVMELVHGVPITKYCDENKLTARQRLELFVPVCQAIQHAHQKGVIHRDLKPSNILVTLYDGNPVPKVIDFGVAKATDQRLTERTLFTQYGAIVGTLEYMAPEQAEMSALGVDTRSDVYSLGVVLYELLTGTTPLERSRLRAAALGEMLRLIREEEPPRPSARISTSGQALATISRQRGTDAGKLSALVRGELDWIVMRALEKDRTRRYESPVGLARDLERYLKDEPVEACPPSATYRLRKLARKHRVPLVVAGVLALALVAGTAASAWQAVRATRAEERADARSAEALTSADEAHENARIAEENAKRASENENLFRTERDRLRDAKDTLRQSLHFTRTNLIENAWAANDIEPVRQLLNQQRPGPGERDLRGFEWYLRDRQAHQESLTFGGGASDPIFNYRPSFSPDMRSVCMPIRGEEDKSGRSDDGRGEAVHDLATGRQRARLTPSLMSRLRYVSWSPDSKYILAACDEPGSSGFTRNGGHYSLYDPTTGRELRRLALDLTFGFRGVQWSPDSRRILTAILSPAGSKGPSRADFRFAVFDASDGSEVYRIQRPANLPSDPKVPDVPTPEMSFSPDGKYLMVSWAAFIQDVDSATGDEYFFYWVAVLYDATTGKPIRQFDGPCQTGFLFSADGRWLVGPVRDADGADPQKTSKIKVWDLTGVEKLSIPVPPAARQRVVPTLLKIAPTGQDWTTREQRAIHSVSPDGRYLTVIFIDPTSSEKNTATAVVWDIAGAKEVHTFKISFEDEPHSSQPSGWAIGWFYFSPDGKWLLTSSDKNKKNIRFFSLLTGKLAATLTHPTSLTVLQFNADGRRLATAGESTAYVWDVPDGGETGTPQPLVLRGHSARITDAHFHPDGARLFTADEMGWVKAWDIGSRDRARIVDGVQAKTGLFQLVAVSANSERVATLDAFSIPPTGDHKGTSVVVWDGAGKLLNTYPSPTIPQSVFSTEMALSPGGERVAIATSTQNFDRRGINEPVEAGLHVCATDTGRPYFEHREPRASLSGTRSGGHGLAFSSDGKCLAWSFVCPGDKPRDPPVASVKVFDLSTRTEKRSFTTTDGNVDSLAFTPDGSRLMCAFSPPGPGRLGDKKPATVRVWDIERGVELSGLELAGSQEPAGVYEIVSSPDGARVAGVVQALRHPGGGGTASPGVLIWDSKSGRRLFTLQRRGKHLNSVAFSPDGRRLAAAISEPRVWADSPPAVVEIVVWDTATGDELMTLKDSGLNSIASLKFSPDGYRLHAVGRIDSESADKFGSNSGPRLATRTWDATPRPEK